MKDRSFRLEYTYRVADRGAVTLTLLAHETHSMKRRHIDGKFYRTFASQKCVPKGSHVEVEILKPYPWEQWPKGGHAHFVRASKKAFVCYTEPLPSIDDALAMLDIWCAGQLFAWAFDRPFAEELQKDPLTFDERLKKDYKIERLAVSMTLQP